MSRIYTVPYSGTLTNTGGDSDLFELVPAAEIPIRLVALVLGQSSDFKDAEEEGLRISILRLPTTFTSGSGGSSVTPVPVNPNDAAASFAAECNNTTIASTSGTAVTVEEFSWNVRMAPLERQWPDPDTRILQRRSAGSTQGLIVRCQSTPADDISITITAYVEEI